jgi:hypothetical protein
LKPKTFRPVLRGLLLTGGLPGYLRAEPRGGQGEASMMEMEPLWWPPSKVAGYYLSRYVATRVAAEPRPPEGAIQIEVDDLDQLLGPPAPAGRVALRSVVRRAGTARNPRKIACKP